MRPTRGSLALALLLTFGFIVPLRADDTPQKQGPPQQGTQQVVPPVADGTLPVEVETDLREQIGELEAEIAQMKTEIADMKALEAKDKAAFDARMAAEEARLNQLQNQQGAAGRVGQVNGEIQQGTSGNRANNGTGTNTRNNGDNTTTNSGNNNGNNNGRTNNGTTNNNGTNNNGQNKPLGFWEQLLLKVVQGAGQAFSKWLDKKLGLIQGNASRASTQLGQRYPTYSNQIDNRINQAVDRALNGGTNYGSNGGNNASTNYGNSNYGNSNGNTNYGVNQGQQSQTVIVQQSQSRTVVVQNGQVTQVTQTNTSTTTTVRQIDRLPVVTDEFGTHPMINITLGDD